MIAKQPYSGGVFPRTNTLQVVVSFFNSPTRSLRRCSLRLPAKEIRMVSWALRSLLSVAGIEGDNWFVGDTYRYIIGGLIGIQRVLLGQPWDNHWDIMGTYLPVTWLANPQSAVFFFKWEIVYEGMVCHYHACLITGGYVYIILIHIGYTIVHTWSSIHKNMQLIFDGLIRPWCDCDWLWLVTKQCSSNVFSNGKRCLTHPSPND